MRRERALDIARTKLSKTQAWWIVHLEQEKSLRKRLEQFEQENADNPQPVEACFRLDAGFGTYDNIALLIEMGYELYVKLHNHKIVQMLRKSMACDAIWTHVGNNAEMAAWAEMQLQNCAYPLDIALERFYIGTKQKHSALAHFGSTPVTTDLPAWFGKYNARQTIEAGIKETKQVFYLQRLKVRSEPAIYLQEAMTIFAANFIRWAIPWIEQHAEQNEDTLALGKMGIKKQVQVAANTSAKVIQNSEGIVFKVQPSQCICWQTTLFPAKNSSPRPNHFLSLFTILALIAQKLR